MAMEMDIATVGGGLGGLVLALGLQERGIRAHVFEKASKVRKCNGTSISLHMNERRAWGGIKPGLIPRLMTKGAQVTQISGIFRLHGEPECVTRRAVTPGSTCAIPWKSAHETLADQLWIRVCCTGDTHSSTTTSLRFPRFFHQKGVEARFEVLSEEETGASSPLHTKVVRAKLLVGVDSIKSQVRKIMVGDEPRDLFSITWNSVVPTVRSLNLHEEGERKFFRYSNANSVKTVFLNDAGSSLTLWLVRTLDVSGKITAIYPLDLEAHGREVSKIRALRQVEPDLEWIENLREVIQEAGPDAVRESRQFDRLPLTSWSDSSKGEVLLGDAAHGMYPGPAQGARTAFEDAHQLFMLPHEALTSLAPDAAIPEAATRYEEMRITCTDRIQAYAAEKTTLPEFIPESLRNLPSEEQRKSEQEFQQYLQHAAVPGGHAGRPEFYFLETMIFCLRGILPFPFNIHKNGSHCRIDKDAYRVANFSMKES